MAVDVDNCVQLFCQFQRDIPGELHIFFCVSLILLGFCWLGWPWAIRFPCLYIDLATKCWNGKVTLGQLRGFEGWLVPEFLVLGGDRKQLPGHTFQRPFQPLVWQV